MQLKVPPPDWTKGNEKRFIDIDNFKNEDDHACILMGVEGSDRMFMEIKRNFSQLNQTITSHSTFIKQSKNQFSQILSHLNARQKIDYAVTQ